MKYDLNEVTRDIEEWGLEKGILPNPVPFAQADKTKEELEDLFVAISNNDRDAIIDCIGDIYVTLVMQCGAWNVDMSECAKAAFDVISKRTGKMVDGQFVKDGE